MNDNRCGCCEGVEKLTPARTANRPGLDALSYRAGTHGTFFETMKAHLSSLALEIPTNAHTETVYPLRGLTTRETDDPAIALLDAWATVADVLTFYQERIANEGYLLTATERRSILELARLVGYSLRPGVASTVYLAFTLEQGYKIEIPARTRARSIPDPGQLPQAFETAETIDARTEWNALQARLQRPHYLPRFPSPLADTELHLAGTATNLKANDVFVLVYDTAVPFQALTVLPDAQADRTLVTYRPYGAIVAPAVVTQPPPAGDDEDRPVALARLGGVLDALKRVPSQPPASRFRLVRSAEETYGASADIGPQLAIHLNPILKDTLYDAYKSAAVTNPPALQSVEAFRVKASLLGHNAPLDLVYGQNGAVTGRREWPLAELGTTLDVRLVSEDPTEPRTSQLLFRNYDIGNNEFPPLRLEILVADSAGAQSATPPVRLSELVRLPPGDEGEIRFQTTRTLLEVTVVVTAEYVPPFEGPSPPRLSRITVAFSRGTLTHQMVISNPGTAVQVQVDTDGVRVLPEGNTVAYTINGRSVTMVLDQTLQVTHVTPRLVRQIQFRTIHLDATYDQTAPNSWILVDRPQQSAPLVTRVTEASTVSRAAYGISGKVTRLVLADPWLTSSDTSLTVLRATTVYAQNEALTLGEIPITDDVQGDAVELDSLYDGLDAGRWIVVSGERTDVEQSEGESVEGVKASELLMLAGIEHDVHHLSAEITSTDGPVQTQEIELPGDTLHTTLIFAEPLAYKYKRDTVTINANVAKATHGETREEVLGSGDGSQPLQQFTLKQSPLTYVAAPTPAGAESTLEVRVNGVEWHETSSLIWLNGNDRGFITQTDDEGRTTLTCGDGKQGARLPTGVENVRAVYRSGIGKSGNAAANQISQLATKPLGVKEVVNPQPATGGADAESRDQARRNSPLAVMALDRLVSVQDYADFARTFAGIAKASAVLSDGRRQLVHLTIAGLDDIPIGTGSDLYLNLSEALYQFGDPQQPVEVDTRYAMFIFISAKVRVLPDYQWELVEPDIRAALLDAFSFDRRDLGQDVPLSEVISTIQKTKGVDYVDVDILDSVAENADVEELAELAETLRLRTRIVVEMGRVDREATDPALRVLPAQIAYLNPEVPDTLILREIES